MNRQQILKQIVSLLVAATWPTPDDAADPLFGLSGQLLFQRGSVVISAEPPESFASVLAHPFAVVSALDAPPEYEFPSRLAVARFSVAIVARGAGDRFGQSAIVGSNRPSQAKSDGQGLENVVELALSALGATAGQLVDSVSGFQGLVDKVGPERAIGETPELAAVELLVAVFNATSARYYHPATSFAGTASGGGAVALSWRNAPTRYDSLRNIVRRSNAGGSAPTAPSGTGSGTGVPVTGGDFGTTATATGLTAGQTYAFTHFTAYDETVSGNVQRYASVTKSVLVT